MDVKKVLDKFAESRILVLGDVMLDCYKFGDVDRISPEAPVGIFIEDKEKKSYRLGGAANTAANIASLAGEGGVSLFGYIGNDNRGEIIEKQLRDLGIQNYLNKLLEYTTLKTRFIARNQQVFREDDDCYADVSREIEERLVRGIHWQDFDVIVASDYAKGTLSRDLLRTIFYNAKRNKKKVILDPKPENKFNYYGYSAAPYIITPNSKEALQMSGQGDIENAGKWLQQEFGNKTNVLVTRGPEGMTLFEIGKKPIHIPTAAKKVYDVSGAGDTVTGMMAHGIAAGLSLEEAAFLANHAAGIVVGEMGTATVSRGELEKILLKEHAKIGTPEEIAKYIENYKKQGKRVVFTNGCFDILHPGHTRYLQESKEQGDILIVGVNSDSSVRKLKGSGRPVNNEKHRAEVLAGLESVDFVFIAPEENFVRYLGMFMPNVHGHGGDRVLDERMITPGTNEKPMNQEERRFAEKNGIKIYFSKMYDSPSTTQTINKIRNKTAQAVKS